MYAHMFKSARENVARALMDSARPCLLNLLRSVLAGSLLS